MSRILESIPGNEKIKRLNNIVDQYAVKKFNVTGVPRMGLGLIALEDINEGNRLFKYNIKNIIGSQGINFGIFFKNTLTIQHSKLYKSPL
jgi:hypothetical protein